MINLKNITKYYDEGDSKLIVLENLDLSINEGEIIILLGKSGS